MGPNGREYRVVEFDHAIYAVRDFEAAADRFLNDFGLAAVPGGRHEGWGTANWIIPLGPSYIELIGVADPGEAAGSFLGRHLTAVLKEGERFVGWVLRADRFDETVARLGLVPSEGSRTRPDGTTLRWRSADAELTMADPSRPFFIEWLMPADLHPGRMEAPHRVRPQGISRVEVRGDERTVRSWVAHEGLAVRVVPGPPALVAVRVGTAGGEVVIR
jgi:Glyoxalase-like domain